MVKYEVGDFFTTRASILSIEDYLNVVGSSTEVEEKLRDVFKAPLLKEALVVASRELFEAVEREGVDTSQKSRDKMFLSLMKYFIRMSTRRCLHES